VGGYSISTISYFIPVPLHRTESKPGPCTAWFSSEMESDYVFLCGVMWCGYGQEEAGRELFRATLSRDPDISTLAWAMFAKGKAVLRRNRKASTDS
jgi:hypothetical protein